MEAEFTFVKAVEGFCREAVKEGGYKGSYLMNVKEQMRRRVRSEVAAVSKVRVLTIGASEVSRMRVEWME
jgi:hypothetical protein